MKQQRYVSGLLALVQVALAAHIFFGTSLVASRLDRAGIPSEALAGALVAGAVLLLFHRTPPMFTIASLPYLVYVLVAFFLSWEAIQRGGLGTMIVYAFSLALMYLFYFFEDRHG